jgi:DNA repair protein RecN (Recombination protein N)
MLLELRISNLAIVDDLTVSFSEGLTVITGETGAGKSIIAGSLSMLLGDFVNKDIVRHQEADAFVEAVFDIPASDSRFEIIRRKGIRIDQDGVIVLRREIRREGRGRVLINGLISSAIILSDIATLLLSVQSQDQKRDIGKKTFAMDILDSYLNLGELKSHHSKLWNGWKTAKSKLDKRVTEERFLSEQIDYMNFQYDELVSANLDLMEEEQLADQLKVIRNLAVITNASQMCSSVLDSSEPSVRELLSLAITSISECGNADTKLAEIYELLLSADSELSEASLLLNSYQDSLPADTSLHDELESREALYFELKRKYGIDTSALIQLRKELNTKISKYKTSTADIEQLKLECKSSLNSLTDCSKELHRKRVQGSRKVSQAAIEVISKMDLPEIGMKFQVEYTASDVEEVEVEKQFVSVTEDGIDDISLQVCMNSGEQFGPITGVSSGGEQSRIYLGLMSMLRKSKHSELLFFDEADAGLGLDSAQSVANLLKSLSTKGQVLCITHLPTMAVAGDNHLKVEKIEHNGRKIVKIEHLDGERRIEEIARLLGGENAIDLNDNSQYKYAEDLLSLGIK